MINIETNGNSFIASFTGAAKRTVQKAIVHSANTAVKSTQTFLVRALVEQGMKRKNAVGGLYINKATGYEQSARLIDRGKKIPLSAFSPKKLSVQSTRGKRQGVTILRNGQRELVPGGFLVAMKSGKLGVFKRVGDARLPIKQLYAGRISEMVEGSDTLKSSMTEFARRTFMTNFKRDFEYYKSKERAE